ncbi:MAG TPA: hypothetical protein VH761_03180 [Ilumatobacteraceae bacterium]
MANALTIPDIVESELVHSVHFEADGLSFTVVIDAGETAVRLMRANVQGEHLPLVVLTTDAQIIAFDSVFVTYLTVGGQPPVAQVGFQAQASRIA